MTQFRYAATSILTAAMLIFWASEPARAQTASTEAIPSHPAFKDRFSFELGAYFSKSSTAASLGPSTGGTGVVVEFEDTLGLEDRNVTPIAGFLWRMSERWRLEFDYFSLNRDATRTLAQDITWGDTTFTQGTAVNSSYDFSDLRIGVGYSFFKRTDKELGVGAGLHVSGIKTRIQATGGGVESSDVTAPLPVLSVYGAFALTNEWAVRMRLDWLSLNYDIYSGDFRSTSFDVVYQPFRNVGFGLGLRNYLLNVEIDDPKWHGRARTVFTGPAAFMRASF